MTSFSVTNKPCKCGYLERSANDPDNPVFFDREVNEYHFRGAGHKLAIYHCPFCGGKASDSHRENLFAVIPFEESNRLHELTKNIKTLEETLSVLGEPEYETPEIVTEIKENEAPITRTFRSYTYRTLSKVADVIIVENGKGGVKIGFQGKYIGNKKESTDD